MEKSEFPALYQAADSATGTAQWRFLTIIKIEYLLLVAAAVLAMNLSSSIVYLGLNALVFAALLGFLLFRAKKGNDRNWYNGRAIAESVKTLTWRYMMRADPFSNADDRISDSEFSKLLLQILKSNTEFGREIAAHVNSGPEISPFMRSIRALPLSERKKFYAVNRIDEQKTWYADKARSNSRSFYQFIGFLSFIYLVAACCTLARIKYPDFPYYPTEPLIALAGTLLAWMQIKKFNELGAAYALTAHEIGLIKISGDHSNDEATFSEHVNDAEFAFSREHTQWVARQAG